MTSKHELLTAHRRYADEAAPALNELTTETLRTDGPANAIAWVATVVISFVLCLGLLALVTGG